MFSHLNKAWFLNIVDAGDPGNCARNTTIHAKLFDSSDVWSERLPSLSSSRAHTNPPIHLALCRCILCQGSPRASTTGYIRILPRKDGDKPQERQWPALQQVGAYLTLASVVPESLEAYDFITNDISSLVYQFLS